MVIDCDWKRNFINKYLVKYGVVIFSGIFFKINTIIYFMSIHDGVR